MAEHLCHAIGCTTPVDPAKLMCLRHWRKVPKHLAWAVYRNYRPGQEIDKNPSDAYLRVSQMAIDAVAKREGI